MPLLYNEKQISELMEDFYILTGMRLALFDENFNQLIKYRSEVENFCDCMRKNGEFDCKCKNSDACCFDVCQKTKVCIFQNATQVFAKQQHLLRRTAELSDI